LIGLSFASELGINSITIKDFKMKKKIISLFTVAILLTSTTFANDSVDPLLQIQKRFSSMFTNTAEVSWTTISDYYQVKFLQAGQHLTAYYNASGEFVSLSRNLSTSMLPLILQEKLQNKLLNSWVTNSFELYRENGTEYFVTVENANEKTIYRSENTDWSTYKRSQK
jgi:hypothetical protein